MTSHPEFKFSTIVYMSKYAKLHQGKPVELSLFKKVAEKNKPTRKVIEVAPERTISVDLVDMHTQPDNGNNYIFNAIDIFSRKAWSYPLKKKDIPSIKGAFEKLFEEVKPAKIWGDEEASWKSNEMKAFFAKHNVVFYHTYGKHKASVVERFNRTMKEQMFKSHGEGKKMQNWTPFIKKFVPFYNRTEHKGIQNMTPNFVHGNKEAQDETRIKVFEPYFTTKKKTKNAFNLGDRVHVKRRKTIFEKGYTKTFTDEIFTISHLNTGMPQTYKLIDSKNMQIKGSFYERELLKAKIQEEE